MARQHQRQQIQQRTHNSEHPRQEILGIFFHANGSLRCPSKPQVHLRGKFPLTIFPLTISLDYRSRQNPIHRPFPRNLPDVRRLERPSLPSKGRPTPQIFRRSSSSRLPRKTPLTPEKQQNPNHAIRRLAPKPNRRLPRRVQRQPYGRRKLQIRPTFHRVKNPSKIFSKQMERNLQKRILALQGRLPYVRRVLRGRELRQIRL